MTFKATTGSIHFDGGFSTVTSPPLTMNPADKGNQISLSNGDLTYTNTTAHYNTVRANNSVSSGDLMIQL